MWLVVLVGCAAVTPSESTDSGASITDSSTSGTLTGGTTAAGGNVVCTMLLDGGRPKVVEMSMQDGTRTNLADLPRDTDMHGLGTLARMDDDSGGYVVFGANTVPLTRVDLGDGTVTVSSNGVLSVTDLDGMLVAVPGETAYPTRFAGWDDLDTRTNGEILAIPGYLSRIGHGASGELLSARHSTDEVDRWDVETGAEIATVPLEGYDTWVWGVSEAAGRLFVADDGRDDVGPTWQVAIHEFDRDGAAVRTWVIGDHVYVGGLSCREIPGP